MRPICKTRGHMPIRRSGDAGCFHCGMRIGKHERGFGVLHS